MHVQMHCQRCGSRFSGLQDTPAATVLERLQAEGPWLALGDGETVEDRLFADLSDEEAVNCPRCAAPVAWSEESLGHLSAQLLGQW